MVQSLLAKFRIGFCIPKFGQQSARSALPSSSAMGLHNAQLIAALELIERHTGEPFLPRTEVAHRIGISTRQLDRLFATHLKRSYRTHYRQVRLERSRELPASVLGNHNGGRRRLRVFEC